MTQPHAKPHPDKTPITTAATQPQHTTPDARPRVVIAGGSGFIGNHLSHHLIQQGYEVHILTRTPPRGTDEIHHTSHLHHHAWDGRTSGPWTDILNHAAALINLAGRNVNCRYHARNRKEILQSRLESVHVLAQALKHCSTPPPVWIQAATLAIYGHRGDAPLADDAQPGLTFSPEVAKAWEQAVHDIDIPNLRKVILRISFALGTDGGALPALARLTRLGLGGRVGDGRQYYSWIHIQDLCRVFHLAIKNPRMSGVYNTTSPTPVRNHEFMRILRHAMRRPWSPPAPAWAVRVGCFLMRTEAELALRSRYGVPHRLTHELDFQFHYNTFQQAIDSLYPAPASRSISS